MTALIMLIIAALAGIYVIAKGQISFSEKREILKPKSTYIGISFVALAIFSLLLDIYAVIGIFVLIMIAAFFLSQKKTEAGEIMASNHSAKNILILIIFAALIAFAFWYFTRI